MIHDFHLTRTLGGILLAADCTKLNRLCWRNPGNPDVSLEHAAEQLQRDHEHFLFTCAAKTFILG
jgi:hypothetical protein